MAEMKTLNGYEVVDAKAREDIKNLVKREIYYFDPSQLDFGEETWATPPEELNEFASRVYSGDLVSLYIKHNTNWVPALYTYDSDSAIKTIRMQRNLLPEDVLGDDELKIVQYRYSVDSDGPYITDSSISNSAVASKEYVDTAIATLEARIAALEALHASE